MLLQYNLLASVHLHTVWIGGVKPSSPLWDAPAFPVDLDSELFFGQLTSTLVKYKFWKMGINTNCGPMQQKQSFSFLWGCSPCCQPCLMNNSIKYVCLYSQQGVVEKIQAEAPNLRINIWYLDDGSLCRSTNNLQSALAIIEREGPLRGMFLNKENPFICACPSGHYKPSQSSTPWNPSCMR